ncbi:hypothetical protein [Haloarcula laminariae]|uniref:hypothetical protein n=1 Tax=Haloarcula laminariae TaxID=2961577 RepID=UPI0021C5AA3E|nr:hypothetical protein [Halomicroarcula laminariae]
MGDLAPTAFDIETSGLEPGSVITVAGLAFELGEVLLQMNWRRDSPTTLQVESISEFVRTNTSS